MLRLGTVFGVVAAQGSKYDPQEGLKFAELSLAAYCGTPKLPDGRALRAWECGPACDAVPGVHDVRTVRTAEWDDNAYAFVGKLDGKCVVGFRGTSEAWGWINDITSAHSVDMNRWGVECNYDGVPCRAGYGWMLNYYHIQKDLIGNMTEVGCLDMPVSITGHSLGGTIGLIAMMDLYDNGFKVVDAYTFGSPRAGDHTFVQAFGARFPNATVIRVTNCKDIVPHVPPMYLGYEHLGTEVYYACDDNDNFDNWKVCDGTGEDLSCSRQWDRVDGLIQLLKDCVADLENCDHLTYMKSLTGFNMGGSHCHDPWVTTTPQPGTFATCDGTAEGAPCMFPFEYLNVTYDSCTSTRSLSLWCYTDTEDHWGYCECVDSDTPTVV